MINNQYDWMKRFNISPDDALRIARELCERSYVAGIRGVKLLNRCRDIMAEGHGAVCRRRRSVSLAHAVEVSLRERADRRSRTTYELRHVCRRILQTCPALGTMLLREISPEQCSAALRATFAGDLQFCKGRTVLHSVFACGVRHAWCSSNPVDAVPRPLLREAEVEPLPWEQLVSLLHTATLAEHRCCMPALGFMLWAGVRPAELQRLSWEDVDRQERVLCLRPRHSKTGGCRHITLHAVLLAWLKRWRQERPGAELRGRICPPNWLRRWKALRHAAGITHWQQDVLRHTYASYHLKRWHDLERLQEEMGHRSTRLLRTRYLSMKGITRAHARRFWTPGALG